MEKSHLKNSSVQNLEVNLKSDQEENSTNNSTNHGIIPKEGNKIQLKTTSSKNQDINTKEDSSLFGMYQNYNEGSEKEENKSKEKTEFNQGVKTETVNNTSHYETELIIPKKIENENTPKKKQEKQKREKRVSSKTYSYISKKLVEKITQKNLKYLYGKRYYKKDFILRILDLNGLSLKAKEIENILEKQKYKLKKGEKYIMIDEESRNTSSDINIEFDVTNMNIPTASGGMTKEEIGKIVNIGSNQENNSLTSIISQGMLINATSKGNNEINKESDKN